MFNPENELEQLLFGAISDFNARAAFYQAFLDGQVFFITDLGERPAEGIQEIPLTEELSVIPSELNGTSQIAVYTSPTRIVTSLQAAGQGGPINYCKIGVRHFFEVTAGIDIAMNPGSECSKIFYKQEIRKLLDGTHADQKGTQIVVPKIASVKAPTGDAKVLANALADFCKKQEKVKTVYLEMVQDPGSTHPPRVVVATEVDEGFDMIKPRFNEVFQKLKIPSPPAEVIEIIPSNDISQMAKANGMPVYKRELKKKNFLGIF